MVTVTSYFVGETMTQKSDDKQNQLIDYVQDHERAWGMETYNGRPDLGEILKSPVVVFWDTMGDNDKRPIITLHNDLKELEAHFSKMIFRSSVKPPKERVLAIYQDNKPVRVKGVTVHFEVIE